MIVKMTSDLLQSILNSNHHAFVVVGRPGQLVAEFKSLLPTNSADVWCELFDDFGVDDGQKVKAWQSTRPLGGGLKYAVWGITSANLEAQNSLLKSLEEPVTDTKIILVIPHEGILLPTVLSRLLILNSENILLTAEDQSLAAKFLSSDPHQRLELIEANFNYKEEGVKGKLMQFLVNCEQVIQQDFTKGDLPKIDAVEIIKAKQNLSDRSAVPRLVMENLATTL